MNPLLNLIDARSRAIPTPRHIKSGGEGGVFALPHDPERAVKIYAADRLPDDRKVEKLTAMIALGRARPQLVRIAAWPTELVYDERTRRPVGFLMPRLNEFEEIVSLYNPVFRLRAFPRAGWSFQVRAAANLAAAFDELHAHDCLMGDVNHGNEMVSQSALVRLIDCDSFQLTANGRTYCTDVGTDLYVPPELQGRSLRDVVRSTNHDNFGLAVLIYQLLFVGAHPYSGIYRGSDDPSPGDFIKHYRFSQGPVANSLKMEPPPHVPTFADIPAEVGMLFRLAFERGSEKGTRPKPREWMAALGNLEKQTATCATDPGHTFWRGANGCVWCRIAANGGPEYYYGVSGGTGTFAVDEKRLQEILRRLEQARLADFPYRREQYLSHFNPEGQPLPKVVAGLLIQLQQLKEVSQLHLAERLAVEQRELTAIKQQYSEVIRSLEAECDAIATAPLDYKPIAIKRAELVAKWKAAEEQYERAMVDRAEAEQNEIESARAQARAQIEQMKSEYQRLQVRSATTVQLMEKWKSADSQYQHAMTDCMRQESNELQQINQKERGAIHGLKTQYLAEDAELVAESEQISGTYRRHKGVFRMLIAAGLLGLGLLPLGFFHGAFLLVGLLMTLIFGALAAEHSLSPRLKLRTHVARIRRMRVIAKTEVQAAIRDVKKRAEQDRAAVRRKTQAAQLQWSADVQQAEWEFIQYDEAEAAHRSDALAAMKRLIRTIKQEAERAVEAAKWTTELIRTRHQELINANEVEQTCLLANESLLREQLIRELKRTIKRVKNESLQSQAGVKETTEVFSVAQLQTVREVEAEYARCLKAELAKREAALQEAYVAMVEKERAWSLIVEQYRARHRSLANFITVHVERCRALEPRFQVESRGIRSALESAARIRHMRLHLIAEANIPSIGARRIRMLTAHGMLTADDIHADDVRAIRGFGVALMSALMKWKREVAEDFRFDEKMVSSAPEHQPIVSRFRDQQRQILNELQQSVTELESLAPACRTVLEGLVPQLRTTIAAWQQAEADLRLIRSCK